MMLSIIIPVKEPEPHLTQLLNEISTVLGKDWFYEVWVQREPGLTNAVVKGVERVRGDIILVMDADGSHDPKYIPKMLEKYGECGIVIGIKDKDERKLYRRLVTKGFALINHVVLNIKIHDLSGFVLASKGLFSVVKPSDDFKFIIPLIYLNSSVKVGEVSIIHPDRKEGKSKANYKQAFRILKLIFKLRFGMY